MPLLKAWLQAHADMRIVVKNRALHRWGVAWRWHHVAMLLGHPACACRCGHAASDPVSRMMARAHGPVVACAPLLPLAHTVSLVTRAMDSLSHDTRATSHVTCHVRNP